MDALFESHPSYHPFPDDVQFLTYASNSAYFTFYTLVTDATAPYKSSTIILHSIFQASKSSKVVSAHHIVPEGRTTDQVSYLKSPPSRSTMQPLPDFDPLPEEEFSDEMSSLSPILTCAIHPHNARRSRRSSRTPPTAHDGYVAEETVDAEPRAYRLSRDWILNFPRALEASIPSQFRTRSSLKSTAPMTNEETTTPRRRSSLMYAKLMDKRIQDQVMEPQTPSHPHSSHKNSPSSRIAAWQKRTSEAALEAMESMTLDTIVEPTRTRSPPWDWIMPRDRIYRDAYPGSSAKLQDFEIERMVQTGRLVEDPQGIRYASDGRYLLYDLGRGKKREDSEMNLKDTRKKEHVSTTLARVNIEDEEQWEEGRLGSPIVDPDEEIVAAGSAVRVRRSVRFSIRKVVFDQDGALHGELVVDNEGNSKSIRQAAKEGRRKRREEKDTRECIERMRTEPS